MLDVSGGLARLNDELAAKHVHPAGESEFARLVGGEFYWRSFEGRQVLRYFEISEDDVFAARGGFVTIEVESNRNVLLHNDYVRRIASFDDHFDLLHSALNIGCDGCSFAKEIPEDERDQGHTADDH
jgi:hypothetical protein